MGGAATIVSDARRTRRRRRRRRGPAVGGGGAGGRRDDAAGGARRARERGLRRAPASVPPDLLLRHARALPDEQGCCEGIGVAGRRARPRPNRRTRTSRGRPTRRRPARGARETTSSRASPSARSSSSGPRYRRGSGDDEAPARPGATRRGATPARARLPCRPPERAPRAGGPRGSQGEVARRRTSSTATARRFVRHPAVAPSRSRPAPGWLRERTQTQAAPRSPGCWRCRSLRTGTRGSSSNITHTRSSVEKTQLKKTQNENSFSCGHQSIVGAPTKFPPPVDAGSGSARTVRRPAYISVSSILPTLPLFFQMASVQVCSTCASTSLSSTPLDAPAVRQLRQRLQARRGGPGAREPERGRHPLHPERRRDALHVRPPPAGRSRRRPSRRRSSPPPSRPPRSPPRRAPRSRSRGRSARLRSRSRTPRPPRIPCSFATPGCRFC